jgi:hypothetical protein
MPHMLPPESKLHLLAEYGAKDIADSMGSWEPLLDASLDTGLVSWLEIDGNMMLCQGWTASIADNVLMGHAMGVQTMSFSHWRVRSLEHNARAAVEAMWDASRSVEEIVDASLSATYGPHALSAAREAHRLLEAATLFAKQRLLDLGASREAARYAPADLSYASSLFTEAAGFFRAIRASADSDGARQAEYLGDLCDISSLHLAAESHLQNAKLPLFDYGAWTLESSKDGEALTLSSPRCPPPSVLEMLCREADAAAALEREYMQHYAKWVSTCDEQGQLVMHYWGAVVPIGAFAAALRARLDAELQAR